jgi:hypothetical protein
MKSGFLLGIFIVFFVSCNNQPRQNSSEDKTELIQDQLNITILLDLSDRVDQPLQPSQSERDIAIVSTIIEIFRNNMEEKGAFKSKDKIRLLFTPAPDDANINNIAKSLNIDLSKLDVKLKKEQFDNMQSVFENGLSDIYKLTLNSKNWIGSDIWRFFKYDANELCIEEDPTYRNILVIITDGYIYHEQSLDRQNNRTAFVTSLFLQNEGFRNNNSWKDKFESQDYGFINTGQTYENLDILVLELNPSKSHITDEDIMRAYLNKWFTEMNVNNYEIFNSDLPINTKGKIERFF